MLDMQTVSGSVASFGVLLAAIYYVLQIRHQTRMRETDLLLRLNSTMFANKELLTDLWRVWDLKCQNYDDFSTISIERIRERISNGRDLMPERLGLHH